MKNYMRISELRTAADQRIEAAQPEDLRIQKVKREGLLIRQTPRPKLARQLGFSGGATKLAKNEAGPENLRDGPSSLPTGATIPPPPRHGLGREELGWLLGQVAGHHAFLQIQRARSNRLLETAS